jgi:Major Facilitator Superfamily
MRDTQPELHAVQRMQFDLVFKTVGARAAGIADVTEQSGGNQLLQIAPVDPKHIARPCQQSAGGGPFPTQLVIPDGVGAVGRRGAGESARIVRPAGTEALCRLGVQQSVRLQAVGQLELLEERRCLSCAACGCFLVRSLSGSAPLGLDSWRWPFAVSAVVALCVAAAAIWLPPIAVGQPSQHSTAASVSQHRARFALAAALYFLSPWATVAFPLLTGPILLHRGLSLRDSLLDVGLATFGPIIATFALGPLMDRIERRTSLVSFAIMMLVSAIGFIALPYAAVTTAMVVLFSTGVALYTPALTVYGAELFPYRSRAAATTIAWALNRLAACLAPIVLIAGSHGSAPVLIGSVCIALLVSVLLVWTGPPGSMGKALE